jgi:hypothetical protein
LAGVAHRRLVQPEIPVLSQALINTALEQHIAPQHDLQWGGLGSLGWASQIGSRALQLLSG